MEKAIELFITKLLEHGPWGLAVAWLMYQNYRANDQLSKYIASISDIQERRATEREKSAEVMVTTAAANIKLADAVNTLSSQVEETGDTIGHKVDGCSSAITAHSEKLVALQTTVNNDIQNRGRKRV